MRDYEDAESSAVGAPRTNGRPAIPPKGPFAAAAYAVEGTSQPPPFVVGESSDDDLVLARALLAAILADVPDSGRELDWAVAVLRVPAGPLVLATSTEGRGWLPPGLYLPTEVTVPWRWLSAIPKRVRESVVPVENSADPARVLTEFDLGRSRGRGGSISALVSSTEIPTTLRTVLGHDVLIQDRIAAERSAVDLTSRGPGLVDRLALAGSTESQQRALAVAGPDVQALCLELARNADVLVSAAVPEDTDQIAAYRRLRQWILDELSAGRPVLASWWRQLRDADDMLAAALRSHRIDVSDMPVGARVDLPDGNVSRSMVFERRVGELLSLLAVGESGEQTLRDMCYAYGQIVEHPLFQEAVGTDTQRAGSISAAPINYGPPRPYGPGPSDSLVTGAPDGQV